MPSLTPAEAAALLAIHAGARNVDEVASLLNTDTDTARRLVERLRSKGLVEVEERRLLFIKRRRLRLTEKGLEAIPEARRILLETITGQETSASHVGGKGAETTQPQQPPTGPPEQALPLSMALLPLLLSLGLLGVAVAATAEEPGEADDIHDMEEHTDIIQYDPEDWV